MNKTSEPLNNLEKTMRHSIFNPKDKLSERVEKFNEIVENKLEEKKEIVRKRKLKAIQTDKLIFGNNKLLNYEVVNDLTKLKVGSHIRYTQNVYRSYDEKTKRYNRKSIYVIIKHILNDGKFEVNSYGVPKYPNWILNPNNKYKDLLIYIKPQKVYSGKCLECGVYTKYPFSKCYDCSNK